jgi:uncharacterized protein (DUF1778 family)
MTESEDVKATVRTIAEYETIVLTEHEREAFFNALINPTKPSQKAMDAAKRYIKRICTGRDEM